MSYILSSITPLDKISHRDQKSLNVAYESAFTSDFNSSLRLGACIKHAKGYVLRG